MNTFTGKWLALLLFSVLMSPMRAEGATAQSDPALVPTSALEEVQGVVVSVDKAGRAFQLRDAKDKLRTFNVLPTTRILNADNKAVSWDDFKEHKTVRLYFNTEDQTVRQIDFIPALDKKSLP